MKKIVLIVALALGVFAQAQQGKHEASLNVGNAIVMKSLDLTYEYYVMDSSSAGISTYFGFAKETADFRYNESTLISPFFRHYFSNDEWRPFAEVFIGFGSGTRKRSIKLEEFSEEVRKEALKADPSVEKITHYNKFSNQAIGVSGGLKYVNDSGLTLSGVAGVGRYLFKGGAPILEKTPLLVLKFGVNVGYQF